MKSNIFIPKKIKVGFNPRGDTYTGRLGYVIYHDGKVWRKETSWRGWIYRYMDSAAFEIKKKEQFDQNFKSHIKNHAWVVEKSTDPRYDYNKAAYQADAKLTAEEYATKMTGPYDKFCPNLGRVSDDPKMVPVEFDNTPIEGFVLNKKAGGTSSGWDHRQTYCRVYDPRGFEFEIVIPNLLYILENASSFKGKGLEGKFIYGWDGKDLVLIPEQAPEYKDMVEFTATREMKVAKKDLVPGGIYLTGTGEKITYLAEGPYYDYKGVRSAEKQLWVYVHDKTYRGITTKPITAIKKFVENDANFVNLLDNLDKDTHFKPKNPKVFDYKPLTDFIFAASRYTRQETVYVLNGKKYERAILQRDYNGFGHDTYLLRKYRGRGETITSGHSSVKALIAAYPIYEQITKNEKVSE